MGVHGLIGRLGRGESWSSQGKTCHQSDKWKDREKTLGLSDLPLSSLDAANFCVPKKRWLSEYLQAIWWIYLAPVSLKWDEEMI